MTCASAPASAWTRPLVPATLECCCVSWRSAVMLCCLGPTSWDRPMAQRLWPSTTKPCTPKLPRTSLLAGSAASTTTASAKGQPLPRSRDDNDEQVMPPRAPFLIAKRLYPNLRPTCEVSALPDRTVTTTATEAVSSSCEHWFPTTKPWYSSAVPTEVNIWLDATPVTSTAA